MVKIVNSLNEIPQDKKVVIDFFAEWCGPCKKIAPSYLELSKKYKDIEFLKCNVDESLSLSEEFNINALPTFVFVNNGKVVNTMEGANINGLKDSVESLNNIIVDTKNKSDSNEKECCVDKEDCNATKEECTSKKVDCDNKEKTCEASCSCIN
jgi:thioredoxin 1